MPTAEKALGGALPARLGRHVIVVAASAPNANLLDALNTRDRAAEDVALRIADVAAAQREYERRSMALRARRNALATPGVRMVDVVGESGLAAGAASPVLFTLASVPDFAWRAGVSFEVEAALRAVERTAAELQRAVDAVAALGDVRRTAPLRSDRLGRTHALNSVRRVLRGAMSPKDWASAVLADPPLSGAGAGAGAGAGV